MVRSFGEKRVIYPAIAIYTRIGWETYTYFLIILIKSKLSLSSLRDGLADNFVPELWINAIWSPTDDFVFHVNPSVSGTLLTPSTLQTWHVNLHVASDVVWMTGPECHVCMGVFDFILVPVLKKF